MKHLLYLIIGFTLAIMLMTGTIQNWIPFNAIEAEIVLCAMTLGVGVLNIRPTLQWVEQLLKPKTW
jgi:hypothetical protein